MEEKKVIKIDDYIDTREEVNAILDKSFNNLENLGFAVSALVHHADVMQHMNLDQPICLDCIMKAAVNVKKQHLDLIAAELERMKHEGDGCEE